MSKLLSFVVSSIILFSTILGHASIHNHVLVIVSQNGDSGYVPTEPDQVSLFDDPNVGRGTIGLLAHNTLAGKYFFELIPGDAVIVNQSIYHIIATERFIEVVPISNPRMMVRVATNEMMTASEVFFFIYGPEQRLVLQTCTNDGYLFVIGEHVTTYQAWLPLINR